MNGKPKRVKRHRAFTAKKVLACMCTLALVMTCAAPVGTSSALAAQSQGEQAANVQTQGDKAAGQEDDTDVSPADADALAEGEDEALPDTQVAGSTEASAEMDAGGSDEAEAQPQADASDIAEAAVNAMARALKAPPGNGYATAVDTRDEYGMQINLFDYSGSQRKFGFGGWRTVDIDDPQNTNTIGSNGSTANVVNGGINSDDGTLRPFVFLSSGTNGYSINSYTGGSATAMQGIVQNKLSNGYPSLNRTSGGASLDYLFDPDLSTDGKKSYSGLTGLFQRDAQGYLYYDSGRRGGEYSGNYAYYDVEEDSKEFTLYNDTYSKQGSTDYQIGFFPFDEYNPSSNSVAPGQKNHHFGMTVSSVFTMPQDGQMLGDDGELHDMIFSFSGDDDVWVFIDGVLVLDLGGIHQPTGGSINFSTGAVTVDGARACTSADSTIGTSSTLSQIFASANTTWDASANSSHTIDFFYLERGSNDSNCMIKMNLNFKKATYLDVEKQWLDGAQEHSDDKVAVQLYRSFPDSNGGYSDPEPYRDCVVLSASNDWQYRFENLPVIDDNNAEIHYLVREGTVSSDGTFTPSEQLTCSGGGSYSLDSIDYAYTGGDKAGTVETYRPGSSDPASLNACFTNGNTSPSIGKATIKNGLDKASITVNKSWSDGAAAHCGDSVWIQLYKGDEPYGDPVELNAGNGWSHTFTNVPADGETSYSVREGRMENGSFVPGDTITAGGKTYHLDSTSYAREESHVVQTPGTEPVYEERETTQTDSVYYRQLNTNVPTERFFNGVNQGTIHSLNNANYWSNTDLIPETAQLPQSPHDTEPYVITGQLEGLILYLQNGNGVQIEGLQQGRDYTVETEGNDTFRISVAAAYAKAHAGETLDIGIPVRSPDESQPIYNSASQSNPAHINLTTVSMVQVGEHQTTQEEWVWGLVDLSDAVSVAPFPGHSAQATLENSCVTCDLRVVKIDADTKAPLAGASFSVVADDGDGIYDASKDTEVVQSGTTSGQAGSVLLTGLDPGLYWIVETSAPTGYQLLDAPIRCLVAPDGTTAYFHESQQEVTAVDGVITVTVEDTGLPQLPSAGGEDDGPDLTILGLCLLVAALALSCFSFVSARKRRRKGA